MIYHIQSWPELEGLIGSLPYTVKTADNLDGVDFPTFIKFILIQSYNGPEGAEQGEPDEHLLLVVISPMELYLALAAKQQIQKELPGYEYTEADQLAHLSEAAGPDLPSEVRTLTEYASEDTVRDT